MRALALAALAAAAQAADDVGFWSGVGHAVIDFGADTIHDTGTILSAPARWDGGDWAIAGSIAGGLVIAGIAFDRNVQSETQEDRGGFGDWVERHVTPLGSTESFYVIGGIGALGLATGWSAGERFARDALEASIIASGLITPGIKLAAGRERPSFNDADHWEPFSGNSSFPSGHTTQAFAVASTAAWVWRDEPWVGVAALGVAGLVGYARIYGNHHYTSDVLAGAVIGAGVGFEVAILDQERRGAHAAGAWRFDISPNPSMPALIFGRRF